MLLKVIPTIDHFQQLELHHLFQLQKFYYQKQLLHEVYRDFQAKIITESFSEYEFGFFGKGIDVSLSGEVKTNIENKIAPLIATI